MEISIALLISGIILLPPLEDLLLGIIDCLLSCRALLALWLPSLIVHLHR